MVRDGTGSGAEGPRSSPSLLDGTAPASAPDGDFGPASFEPFALVDDALALEPEAVIAEGIVLKRRLWEGEEADLWLARHDGRGEDVAVEIVHEVAWKQRVVRQLHARKVATARAVTHPHATSILEEGTTDTGVPYLVMEILSGLSLRELVDATGPLPADEVVELVAQVGAALGHAHDQGVVHGELTWDDVMIVEGTTRLHAKVANFREANPDELGQTARRRRLQTPVFFAPERLAGEGPVDAHADLWGLAVMAFWALVGRPPYPARSLPVYVRTMRGDPVLPRASELRPELPPAVDAVFERALAVDRAARFASAEELVANLREALAGVEVDPARTPPLQRATAARDGAPPGSDPRSSRAPRSLSPRTYAGPRSDEADAPLSREPAFISLEEEPRYEPGVHVAPHLELRAFLGQGTMGQVWRARDDKRGEDVAVKLVSRAVWGERQSRARFQREARLARQIVHPHVVAVHEFGRTPDDLPYLSMELVVGRTLEERVEERGPLPLAAVARLVAQLAGVLGELHDLDVIHRDVKPANILVVADGDDDFAAKLADFGIAKATDPDETNVTKMGVILGTPFYMNPEQLLGREGPDATSDLWALAAVAYHALTGRTPFPATSLTELLLAMRAGVVRPPSEYVPELPPSVDAFFARALAPAREERFTTAEALAQAFAEAASVGVRAVDPPEEIPVLPPPKASAETAPASKPVPWVGIAVALAVLLLVAWLALR